VKTLAEAGYYDFSFISQDSSSFGRDMGMSDGLIELIGAIEQIEGVKSARILYLYPSTTTFALIDAISDSDLFQTYYDMPIQHIDNDILKVMKRGFGESKTIELLEYMRSKPDSFVRTSVIAGHPEEGSESFEKLCRFMEEFGFDRFNTFAYSNEESTTAYEMEQCESDTIFERTEILGAIAQKSIEKSLESMVNRDIVVVIDGQSDEHEYLLSARPLAWAVDIDGEVLINDTSDLSIEFGGRYLATITEIGEGQLFGSLVERLD
jgi:tRNA A37 methylthiotransferase MiaB